MFEPVNQLSKLFLYLSQGCCRASSQVNLLAGSTHMSDWTKSFASSLMRDQLCEWKRYRPRTII